MKGVISKLSYLKSLGVTAIYLNPIFEAHSNHRYNTADYLKIDPLLGNEEDFRALCAEAAKLGMGIILDGVFNHTGDDSVYFNRYGRYPGLGAAQSRDSAYFTWYDFQKWPEQYRCWWNFTTLPGVNENNPAFAEFVTGKGGVLEHWLAAGASGFRLDVADELPTPFLEKIRRTIKAAKPEALLVGEVWEDASNKTSYGERRHYLEGNELDGVMNYPFRNAIIAFLKGSGAQAFKEAVMTILEHYPKPCIDVLMNLLGTHDTPRILTELAGDRGDGHKREWKAILCLDRTPGGWLAAHSTCSCVQFFLPAFPALLWR